MLNFIQRIYIVCTITLAALIGNVTIHAEEKTIEVAASTAIVADWVKAVGGDLVTVHTLIESGKDPHTFRPSPKDVAKLYKQEAVFLIGHGLALPVESVLEGYKGPILALAEKITEDLEEHDEHGHDKHDEHGHDKHDEHGHDKHDEHGHDKHDDHGHDEHDDHGHDEHDEHGHDKHDEHGHDEHDDHGHDEHEHDEHGHGSGGIEWAGAFSLDKGSYTWSFEKIDGTYADPAMKMLYLASEGDQPIEAVEIKAAELFENKGSSLNPGGQLQAGTLYSVQFDDSKDTTVFSIEISEKGTYVFFTEHLPYEFEATQHFLKTAKGIDVEPLAEVPDGKQDHHGHDHHGHDHHGHDHHGEHDPHIWLDVQKAKAAIHLIEKQLIALHPDDADAFKQNAEAYEAKLDQLEHWIKEGVATIPEANRILITGHNAFGHFAEAYGFRNLGSLNPSLSSAHISPDPKHMSELAQAAKAAKVPAVFPETGHSPKLIKALAREAGIAVAPALSVDNLSAGNASTYLGYMRSNTAIIIEALGGKVDEDHHHDH